MKILFVLEYYHPHIGGVETFFKKLTEGLAEKGLDVTVVTSQVKNSKKWEVVNKVKIKRLPLPRFAQRYWFTILAPFYLIFLVKEYDLIQTTTYNAAWPAWLVAFLFRKKIVLTVHEVWGKLWYSLTEMNFLNAFLHYIFERFILKLPFDHYVAVSDYTKKALADFGIAPEKLKRIYHGIDYRLFNPSKYNSKEIKQKLNISNYFVLTYFGRPGWAKGLSYLIQAMPFIKRKIPMAKLMLIISDDPRQPYSAIKKLIKELKMENDIIEVAPVPRAELPEYIVASNCVVIPSLSEGFGFSAVEASAMNVPVVVTSAGSLPEVISGKVVFCQAGNSEAIAEGVFRVYKKEYQNIPLKKFSWKETIKQYEDCYINPNLLSLQRY